MLSKKDSPQTLETAAELYLSGMAVGWHMDSKHDTLVRVLKRLEALNNVVDNSQALDVDTSVDDGFHSFPPEFEALSEFRYRLNLDHSTPSNSSMTIKRMNSDGQVYNFFSGNLFVNSLYYSGGTFRLSGGVYRVSAQCTSTDADAALDVIESFSNFSSKLEPVSSSQCKIYENGYGAYSNLVLHWSCEFATITNEIHDLSSIIVFRAGYSA